MPTIPCCTTAKSPGSVVNCKSLPLSSSSTSTTSSAPSWSNYEKMDKRAFLIMILKHLNPVSLRIVKAWSGFQGGQDHPLLIKHVAHSILLTAPTLPQDWVQLTLQQPVPIFFKMCSTFSTQINIQGCLTGMVALLLARTSTSTAALPGPRTSHKNSLSSSPFSPLASLTAFSIVALGTWSK